MDTTTSQDMAEEEGLALAASVGRRQIPQTLDTIDRFLDLSDSQGRMHTYVGFNVKAVIVSEKMFRLYAAPHMIQDAKQAGRGKIKVWFKSALLRAPASEDWASPEYLAEWAPGQAAVFKEEIMMFGARQHMQPWATVACSCSWFTRTASTPSRSHQPPLSTAKSRCTSRTTAKGSNLIWMRLWMSCKGAVSSGSNITAGGKFRFYLLVLISVEEFLAKCIGGDSVMGVPG